MKKVIHHSSGFRNCLSCTKLLLKERGMELNIYWCKKCKKSSIATKPIKYKNCPCGNEINLLNKYD